MNKKALSLVLASAVAASVFSGLTLVSADEEPVTISIYQDKYEIDEALKAATEAYTALHPNVTFTVESSSSGDFYTQLKTMFASGQGPDIFSTKGSDDMAIMAEYMEDLSGEAWVEFLSDAARAMRQKRPARSTERFLVFRFLLKAMAMFTTRICLPRPVSKKFR